MPTTTNDGVSLFYETDGTGQTITFIGDAGYGSWQWAWQYDTLAGPYETIIWDHRGTGRSDTPQGPYDVEMLAADLEAILAANSVRRTHLVGAGLGGMVALQYAHSYERAKTLTLLGTAQSGDQVDTDAFRALHPADSTVDAFERSLAGAFSSAFRATHPDAVSKICSWRMEEDAKKEGLTSQLAAITSFDAPPLYEITLPTLVCHGVDDPVISTAAGRELAAELPRGRFEPVEGRHLCHIEHANAVTDRLDGFLIEQTDDSADS